MIKKCECRSCCNFFTLGRKKRFCSKLCNKRTLNLAWANNNLDKSRKSQRDYKRNRYLRDEVYRELRKKRNNTFWHSASKEQKDRMRNTRKEYLRMKFRTDLNHKIRNVISSRIKMAIKSISGEKSHKTIILLGCTIPEARRHLEDQFSNGMTWGNHGRWHIDHIKPCAAFDLRDESQQLECFNYQNLQPLWAKENLSKGDKF